MLCNHHPTLARSDVNLWAEDLPAKVLVVISGQDDLIHVQEVSLVLAREHVAAVFPSQMFHSSELHGFCAAF